MRVISFAHLMGINWNQPAAKTAQPTSQNGGEDCLPLFVYQENDEMEISPVDEPQFCTGSHP
jgi:hypothetical protein